METEILPAAQEKESSAPKEDRTQLPDYVKVLPYSFGFTIHDIFIQGTMVQDSRNGQIYAVGNLPDGKNYIDFSELHSKTGWSDDKMKEFLAKLQALFNKQQSGK